MASSQRGARTLGSPSEKPDAAHSKTLASMLRDTRKELKLIDERREALQNEIKASWAAISKAQSDYWLQEANDFEAYVKEGGENNFDNWRGKFFRKEARRAKDVAEQQSGLRLQIHHLEEGLAQLDGQYWGRWNACLEAVSGGPSKKTPSRKAKSPDPSGPSGIRKTPSKMAVSTPRRHRATNKASLKKALGRLATSSPANVKAVTPTEREEIHAAAPAQLVARPAPSTPKPRTEPTPGTIYQAFYDHKLSSEKGWYLGTPLPWNGEAWKDEIRLDFTMGQMDLMPDFPECYIPRVESTEKEDEQGNTVSVETITAIEGWAPGFEDGGPREKDRRILFLFFDDRSKRSGRLNIPKKATSTIKFSKGDLAALPIDWVATKDLRPAGVSDEAVVRGRSTAGRFKRLMDKIQEAGAPRGPRGAAKEELGGEEAEGGATGFSPDTASQTRSRDTAIKGEKINGTGTSILGVDHERHGGHQGAGQTDLDPFALARSKMDFEDEYDEKIAALGARDQTASAPMDDPEEFDEGVGMDYDLDLGKSKFQPSPGDGHQDDTRGMHTY